MTDGSTTMNIKINNDIKSSTANIKSAESLVKEERRRTGRYIAILVGIMLFILALYHAWVRRIPIVASLVVPALIMFIYVAWVLYTASRDKHRLLDAEAALQAQQEAEHELHISELSNNLESVSSKENSNFNSPSEAKGENNTRSHSHGFILPIILINDKPHEDLDQKWLNIVEKVSGNDKVRTLTTRRKYRRKFCRKRRYIAKRSYSIG